MGSRVQPTCAGAMRPRMGCASRNHLFSAIALRSVLHDSVSRCLAWVAEALTHPPPVPKSRSSAPSSATSHYRVAATSATAQRLPRTWHSPHPLRAHRPRDRRRQACAPHRRSVAHPTRAARARCILALPPSIKHPPSRLAQTALSFHSRDPRTQRAR
eukprot:3618824-Prymnesium_polylepis.2